MTKTSLNRLTGYPRISALKQDREPWRIDRLCRLLAIVDEAAATDARRIRLRNAIVRIRDEKGELQILWDLAHFDVTFIELMRQAWRSLDEFQPLLNMIERFPDRTAA